MTEYGYCYPIIESDANIISDLHPEKLVTRVGVIQTFNIIAQTLLLRPLTVFVSYFSDSAIMSCCFYSASTHVTTLLYSNKSYILYH